MKFYDRLSRIGFLKKYSYKFLFIAFLGIHIPLIGVIIFVLTSQRDALSGTAIVILTLVMTLLATGVTLFFLNRLLDPLIESKDALEHYMDDGKLPHLPTQYSDEAGILMHRLQYTMTRLDDLVRSKDALIGLVSHDVRKPLSHIISYAELARQSTEPEKTEQYTTRIIESGNKQLQMLERILLMLKQHEIGVSEENLKQHSVADMIDNLEEANRELLTSKSLVFRGEVEEGMQLKVHKELFDHVLQNLLQNAAKFSDAGGSITCSAGISGKYAHIHLRDEGIGFDPMDTESIFQRFTKKRQEGTSGEASTGLGLYVSRQIVEKHGGTLTASSEGQGRGAVFTILLPVESV